MTIGKARVTPTLAVTDLAEARRFYGETLGLKEVEDEQEGEYGAAIFEAGGGTRLFLYSRPTPSGSTATACEFSVEDVEGTVSGLRERGVKFEDYDLPDMGIETREGVATMDGGLKSAWFKDPSGNILAISNALWVESERGVPSGASADEAPADDGSPTLYA